MLGHLGYDVLMSGGKTIKKLQTQLSKYHGTKCHVQNFIPSRSIKTKDTHPIKSHRTSSAQAIHAIVSVLLTDDIRLWMYILRFGVLNNWYNQAHIHHVTCYYINNIKVLNVFYHLWPFNCWPTCHITVSVLVTLKTPYQSEVLYDNGILTIIHYKWSWRNLEKLCISEKAALLPTRLESVYSQLLRRKSNS